MIYLYAIRLRFARKISTLFGHTLEYGQESCSYTRRNEDNRGLKLRQLIQLEIIIDKNILMIKNTRV